MPTQSSTSSAIHRKFINIQWSWATRSSTYVALHLATRWPLLQFFQRHFQRTDRRFWTSVFPEAPRWFSSAGTNETVKQRSTSGFSFLLVWAKTNTVVKHRGGCVLQWHMLVVLRVFKCVCVSPGGLLLQLPERETAKTIKVRLAGDIKGNTKA